MYEYSDTDCNAQRAMYKYIATLNVTHSELNVLGLHHTSSCFTRCFLRVYFIYIITLHLDPFFRTALSSHYHRPALKMGSEQPEPHSKYMGRYFVACYNDPSKRTQYHNPAKLELAAKETLSPESYDYVAGGAGNEETIANNAAAFQAWQIGALVDGCGRARNCRTDLSLLGSRSNSAANACRR